MTNSRPVGEWTVYRAGTEYVVITYSDDETGEILASLRMTLPGAQEFFAKGYETTHRLTRRQEKRLRKWGR